MKYHIYVINLDRNTERWKRFQANLEKQGIYNWVRYSAFEGKQILSRKEKDIVHPNALLAAKRGYRISHDEHNYGSIGCYLSHMGCWQRILDSGEEYGVVFEDDVDICSQFQYQLGEIILNAPPNWDIIIFGQVQWLEPPPKKTKKVNDFTYNSDRFILFNSYIIRNSACRALLQRATPVRIQVDWWISSMMNVVNVWVLNNPITWQNGHAGRSDIKHTPVVPDWLAADELAKYEANGEPGDVVKKMMRDANSNSADQTTAIVIIVIVTAVIMVGIIVGFLSYLKNVKLAQEHGLYDTKPI